jgi:hypothetical protein
LGDQVLHFDHQIYLDAGKHRSVCITAPAAVSLPEMERIKQWVATLFIVEGADRPNADLCQPETKDENDAND